MSKTITIAPVRKSIVVKAPQALAFDVFVHGIDRWWPKGHSIGATPLLQVIIEPHKGGRWYGRHEDGAEVSNGHVLAWEPPSRVVFSWEISSEWKPDSSVASEVEVRFIAEGEATRVELEHRNFEALGEAGGEKMRGEVDGGWVGILDLYRQAVEG